MKNRITWYRTATGVLGLVATCLLDASRCEAQQRHRVGVSVPAPSRNTCTFTDCVHPRLHQGVPTRASAGRITGQVAGGALAAAALGFLLWNVVDNPEGSDRKVKGDAGYTPNANTAFAIGSFVGAVAAVQLIGQGDGSRSSLGRTALGAGIATIPLLLGREEPYLPILGIVFGAPLQSVGATIGYRSGRYVPGAR